MFNRFDKTPRSDAETSKAEAEMQKQMQQNRDLFKD